ncbi:MAG: YheU family protein [Steroidobacteraceae bacterium]
MTNDVPGRDASTGESAPAVIVPHDALSPEALRGVVEAFVLREGTDYGEREASFESKIGDVLRQLQRGEADIVFDPDTETVGIVPRGPGLQP